MDTIINLSTYKYLPWKMRLFTLTARCYEEMKDHSACRKSIEYALFAIKTLRDLESRDPPIPQDVLLILDGASREAGLLLFKYDIILKKENLNVLNTKFTTDKIRLVALSEILFSSKRRVLQQEAVPEHLTSILPNLLDITSKLCMSRFNLFSKELDSIFDNSTNPEDVIPTNLSDAIEIIPLPLHLQLCKIAFDYKAWDLFRSSKLSLQKRLEYHSKVSGISIITPAELNSIYNQVNILHLIFGLKYPAESSMGDNISSSTTTGAVVEVENVPSTSSARSQGSSNSKSASDSARSKGSQLSGRSIKDGGGGEVDTTASISELPKTAEEGVNLNIDKIIDVANFLEKLCFTGDKFDNYLDMIIDCVRFLWDPYLVKVLKNFDQQIPRENNLQDNLVKVLEISLNAIHNISSIIDVQDAEMLSTVSLRLALILESSKQYRRSIQVISLSHTHTLSLVLTHSLFLSLY